MNCQGKLSPATLAAVDAIIPIVPSRAGETTWFQAIGDRGQENIICIEGGVLVVSASCECQRHVVVSAQARGRSRSRVQINILQARRETLWIFFFQDFRAPIKSGFDAFEYPVAWGISDVVETQMGEVGCHVDDRFENSLA